MSLKVYVIEVTSMVQMHSSEKRDDFYFKVRGKKTLSKKNTQVKRDSLFILYVFLQN